MQRQSRSVNEVLHELDELRKQVPDVHAGRLFGLVHPSGRKDIEQLIHAVYEWYLFRTHSIHCDSRHRRGWNVRSSKWLVISCIAAPPNITAAP